MRYSGVAELALAEMRDRSKKRIYKSDPQAWLSDVLGKRWYSKQIDIAEAFVRSPRVAVKSANGCGKSASVADLITWFISVNPPDETLAIISAPTISQIEKVVFAYLKTNYASAKVLGTPLIGEISEQLTWTFPNPHTGKKEFLAFGKRPSDSDIVSSFQGTRKMRTGVFLDEGGGLPSDMFTAAEAVATGSESRIITIGNPDRRGTEFHRIFTDPKLTAEWDLLTISAFDLPTFTGEKVYDDPVKQDSLLKALTSVEWVEHKRRAWGEGDARWMSKVLGEFPGEADNTFFGQHVIDRATETDIEEDMDIPPILGVDIARWGDDESVIYVNRGGRVRIHPDGVWGKCDVVDSAAKIHSIASNMGASEVRVDSAGIGGAVFDILEHREDRNYVLIGVNGANASRDNQRWSNVRSYNHDYLREAMLAGKVDIDYEDKQLRDELIAISFKFNSRGAIQITPKDEMRTALGGSPDRLDAVIYAVVDSADLVDDGPRPGEVVAFDPSQLQDFGLYDMINGKGWPI